MQGAGGFNAKYRGLHMRNAGVWSRVVNLRLDKFCGPSFKIQIEIKSGMTGLRFQLGRAVQSGPRFYNPGMELRAGIGAGLKKPGLQNRPGPVPIPGSGVPCGTHLDLKHMASGFKVLVSINFFCADPWLQTSGEVKKYNKIQNGGTPTTT